MRSSERSLCCFSVLVSLFVAITSPMTAQRSQVAGDVPEVEARPLLVEPMDREKRVVLKGTVSRQARKEFDRGKVESAKPAERMLVLLNRPPEREAAFQSYLEEIHTAGSSSYHRWLTPEEIGRRFGAADSDVEGLRGWLAGAGFRVNRTSKAKRFVEFSGTVGQVNAAFHTELHAYEVNGEVHHANATELQIPRALAGLILGMSPLNDFRPQPTIRKMGTGRYDGTEKKMRPDFTLPSDWAPLKYGVVPADLAVEYDLAPLYAGGVTGTGKTIGIINYSNIDVGLDSDYRSVFGLAANPVQVVVDGADPGVNGSEVEAYLDVEVSGAVAPGATINLYIADGSISQDGLALAALRAVEDNQADVLSVSYGQDESLLGVSGNLFWNALWEQAAAQGQTVLVSSGDYGSTDIENQLGVNGLGSTPWNVSVGGTDFYYSDYKTGAASSASLWNATNDAVTKGSLKARLPEQVWNDAAGLDAIGNGILVGEIYAGGGGLSSCVEQTKGACTAGYAKPAWQQGNGVPADGVRDLPDVSLFASNGANFSGWIICDYEGSCVPDAKGDFGFGLVGGTSASTPAMAGILALIDQKYGRQGQANYTLYPLAQQKPADFHDVSLGSNRTVCIENIAQCVAQPGHNYSLMTVYDAGPGYDAASGLGSVDATQLVNDWGSLSFRATSTTLQLSSSNVTHGTSVTLTAGVSAASGSSTPTGDVAVLTNSTLPVNAGQTAIPLNNGTGSVAINYLPGGTYQVTGRYGGDGSFASSVSSPQTLTVSPEASSIQLSMTSTSMGGSGIGYGDPIQIGAQPVGASATTAQPGGAATGSIQFKLDSTSSTAALNAAGLASWRPSVVSVGSHGVNATYAGDASYSGSSSATPLTFDVGQGTPATNIDLLTPPSLVRPVYPVSPGGNLTMTAEVGASFRTASPLGTAAPTGTVTICLGQNPSVNAPCTQLN
jgi:subtilase family serine protease